MAGTLLSTPVFRAVDGAGAPMPGAQLQFYLTGTTTPASVYASATLAAPLANPVVADAGGLFAPIYLDPTVTYRCQLLDGSGALIRDIDPAAAPASLADGSVTTTKLAAGAALANLGYAPLNRAGDTATNLLLANTALATTSAGFLGAPVNEQDGAYTLVLTDAGKMIRANSAAGLTYTIPPIASVAFPVGNTAFVFRNVGAGVVTLTPGTGVTFLKAGSTTVSASIALAQGGLCTALMETANGYVFSGVGMT